MERERYPTLLNGNPLSHTPVLTAPIIAHMCYRWPPNRDFVASADSHFGRFGSTP
jgi:hypothetical protein